MNPVVFVMVAMMLLDLGMHIVAGMLNLRSAGEQPPEAFRGLLANGQYEKARAYLKVKTHAGWIADVFDLSILMLFWSGGGFGRLDNWVRSLELTSVASGIVYIGVLLALKSLLSAPFGMYLTFVVEERFGFNRTSWPTYLADRVKSLFLAAALGIPLLAVVLALFNDAGSNAWWYCWLAVTGFMFLVHYVAPVWIMPLFNRFDPLAPGALRQAILAYTQKIDFKVENIFIMDGSRRSAKSNAFFTGFGHHRRIVLYDTLVEAFSVAEVTAVLAHEIGHYKKHHIGKMMVVNILQAGLMFFILSIAIGFRHLFEAFYIHQSSVYAGLVLFGILYAPLEGWMAIAVRSISRHHEYAADRFSVETTNNKSTMMNALKKLSIDNLSCLQPHSFYVFLNYSHPPVPKRIEAIEKIEINYPAPGQRS